MSVIYFIIFKMFGEYIISGTFHLGRFVDLLQMDICIFLLYRILRYERWRCNYILDKDKE